jgi:hypothetical protein
MTASAFLLAPLSGILFVISLVIFAVKLWAVIDAAMRKDALYRAADKQTKQFWLIVLLLALVVSYFGFLSILGLIAALVYLLDVRPALRSLRGGGHGSSSSGPYGPW